MLFFTVPLSAAHEVLVLKSADIKPYEEALEGFKKTCGCRTSVSDIQDLKTGDLRDKADSMRVNAIFAIGTDALKEAQSIKDIPIVHALTSVSSHSDQESRNISGVSMAISAQRQLDAIVRAFHGIRTIGCIYDEKHSGMFVREAQQAADSLGIELILSKVQSLAEVPSRIDAMRTKIDLFWMLPDTTVINAETLNHLLLFSFQNKIPIFSFSKKYVEQGAVAALIVEPWEIGLQSGELMKKILSSPKGKEQTLQSPRKLFFVINRKIAAKLNLQVSADIPVGPFDVR